MKKSILLVLTIICLPALLWAQGTDLPNTQIKDVASGKKVTFRETIEPGKVTLINFWATWCVPCKKEISNIRKKLPEWKKDADFNYITISIDESRAEGMVRGYAKSQGWDFPYYIDTNSDLKRSLNFQTVPFTIVIDKNGKVAYTHAGYEEGVENEVFAKIKELSK